MATSTEQVAADRSEAIKTAEQASARAAADGKGEEGKAAADAKAGGEAAPAKAATSDPTEESLARIQGWTSKDDWVKQGKAPEQWKDSKAFLEYGRENSKLLKERMGKMERTILDLTTRAERGEQAARDLAELTDTAAKRGYERARKELLTEHARAVKDGDGEAAAASLDKLDKLEKPAAKKEESKTVAAKPPEPAPEFVAWQKQNAWYGQDKEMTRYAERIGRSLAMEYHSTNTKPDPAEFMQEVEAEVRGRFPDKFRAGGGAPPSPDGDAGGGNGGGKRGVKSYDDLPAEAKAACDRITATKHKGKPIMTRDQYIKKFFEE